MIVFEKAKWMSVRSMGFLPGPMTKVYTCITNIKMSPTIPGPVKERKIILQMMLLQSVSGLLAQN
jgi:hypothetical protein